MCIIQKTRGRSRPIYPNLTMDIRTLASSRRGFYSNSPTNQPLHLLSRTSKTRSICSVRSAFRPGTPSRTRCTGASLRHHLVFCCWSWGCFFLLGWYWLFKSCWGLLGWVDGHRLHDHTHIQTHVTEGGRRYKHNM